MRQPSVQRKVIGRQDAGLGRYDDSIEHMFVLVKGADSNNPVRSVYRRSSRRCGRRATPSCAPDDGREGEGNRELVGGGGLQPVDSCCGRLKPAATGEL